MVELTADGSDGDVVVELFGPVVTPRAASRDPSLAPLSVGAEVGSNNTGELCGIVEALLWARAGLPTGKALEIRYDSEYACKVVTGVYRAVKNVALVARGQQALRDAIGAGLAVTFVHVKGHSGDPGNDRADALAKSGASGGACGVGRWAARAALGPKSNAADYLVRSLDPCSGQGSTAHESRPAVAACSPSEHDLPRAESNKERALSLAPVLVVDVGSESSDDDVTILK
jgi:ribonuclease HI